MDSTIAAIREFDRYYTSRLGVLSARYLGQHRPLAQARVLFEVGIGGTSVSELRRRLELDSGYLARLLRSLERQGLVVVSVDHEDRRTRNVSLTEGGDREFHDLNRRSDAAVRDLMSGLSSDERAELSDCLRRVHRLLLRSDVEVGEVDLGSPEAQAGVLAYAEELDRRFPEGFDRSELVSPEELRGVGGVCLVARRGGRVLGCGVLRPLGPGVSEVKHLWVSSEARGLGFGATLLAALEARAAPIVRLDTHRELTEAIALYERAGYRRIEPYGSNPHAHVFFEKRRHP